MYGRVQKRVLQAVNVRTSNVKRYVSHVIVIDMYIVFRAMAPAGDGCERRDDKDMANSLFFISTSHWNVLGRGECNKPKGILNR